MEIKIRKFDPSVISSNRVVVFIGKRNTGKSFLLKDVLYYHRDTPLGVVISPTEAANPFYNKIIPSLFIHDEYTPDLLNNIVKRQRSVKKRCSRNKDTVRPNESHFFLILDDCLYDDNWKKDKNIRYLFQNGRHIDTLLMITMQDPLGIKPHLRSNIDYVFILRDPNTSNRKKIYDNYASVFPNFKMFCQFMDKLTDGYGCIVIDNTTRSNRLEDAVFWYKGDSHPEFRTCSQEFWDMSDQKYKSDDEDEDSPPDVSKTKKISPHSINIKKVHN